MPVSRSDCPPPGRAEQITTRIAYFSQAADTTVRVLTDEFLSVNTFYSMMEKYWQQLPHRSKEKGWVYDQITRAVAGK